MYFRKYYRFTTVLEKTAQYYIVFPDLYYSNTIVICSLHCKSIELTETIEYTSGNTVIIELHLQLYYRPT